MTRTTEPSATGARRTRRRRWVAALATAGGLAGLLALPALPATAAPEPAAAAAAWAGNSPNTTGGTDYFVDARGGDDSAAGTSATAAWRTLGKVNGTTFAPGDRILLKAGETWSDAQLWPKGSGTEGKPIAIDAYGESTSKPYIAANGTTPSPFRADGTKNPETVGLTGAVVLRNQQYWSIANLEVSNDDDFGTNITTGRYVRDGISVSVNADLFPAGTADTIMDGIRISDVHAHDIDGPSTWQRIHYGGINFQVFGSKQYTEYPTGANYFRDVRIERNTFKNVELHAIQFGFNWFGDALGQTDESGKYHEGWEQLWIKTRDLYNRDVYIGHNYAESTGQGPFQLAGTKDMVVEYNEANGWLERYNQVSAGLYLWAGADTVMRFNEVYGGPANEYDATPWDLEFTNFDVRYEYNYSHDNEGGWMAYMGNSSNSIARYNLSVNDNGVIWKNMLSTNYSPTYVLNNVFVYDGADLESVHDEVLKDTVYFLNNVFYNTSTTTTTTWARKPGGLDKGVFSHNAYYEASGSYSTSQPADAGAVKGDPKFVGNPADYAKNAGVDKIRESASLFQLRPDSPLVDAGRFNARVGTEDFFGNGLYYGEGLDIGLHERPEGTRVTDPVDTDPIEDDQVDPRTNLALGKPAVASSTHPHNNFALKAANLTDGDPATRWAGADDATYPLTVDIDLGADTTFDEVQLSEFLDSGTAARVQNYDLQRWDAAAGAWVTFSARTDGIGSSKVVKDFGSVTTAKFRLSITSLRAGEVYAPTMTEIRLYADGTVSTDPTVTPAVSTYDRNPSMAQNPRNTVDMTITLDGDVPTELRYVSPSGAVVGTLDPADYTLVSYDGVTAVFRLTPAFFADKELGRSQVQVGFQSQLNRRIAVEIVDSTGLEAAVAAAKALPVADTAAYRTLAAEIATASAVLDSVNRTVDGTGNDDVTQAAVAAAATRLQAAVTAYQQAAKRTSTTTLTASSQIVRAGRTITLTATVSPSDATGRVRFTRDGALLAVVPVRDGKAQLLTVAIAGQHRYNAVYTGDTRTETSRSKAVWVAGTGRGAK